MAKYSTGSSDNKLDPDSEDSSCELCGSSDNLVISKISGTKLITCKSCSNNSITQEKNTDEDSKESESKSEEKSSIPKKGRLNSNPDSTWVEKDRADYGSMKKPYMKPNYSDILKNELGNKSMKPQELSEKVDLNIEVIRSLLDKNVLDNNISKSQVSKIEDYLNIDLQENL